MFVATEVLPGDVAKQLLGQNATPEAVAELRHQLGLESPAIVRYGDWVGSALHGDFGHSLVSRQPVSSEIAVRLRNTALLASVAIAIGFTLSFALGILAALTRDRAPDIIISVVTLVGMSIPEFVVATVLVLLFSVHWHLFPAVVTADPGAPISELFSGLWLPAISLTIVMSAYIVRMLRTTLIDTMASEYVTMAQLKGVGTARVVLRHALPSALAPTLNVVALTVAWLLGGVVIVENVFNYPGIGTYTVQAVHNRDLPVLQALGLLGALTYVVTGLLADLGTLALNPRLRTTER
jgi:peptide/nickel transport system permease protein